MAEEEVNEQNDNLEIEGDDLEETEVKSEYIEIKTAPLIDVEKVGDVVTTEKNSAVTMLKTNKSMVVDSFGLVHSGFIYGAANYAALLAINEMNSITVASNTKFLAPIEDGNQIEFRATVLQSESKKREVKVEGFVLDIKVFDSIFQVAVFDKHILRLKISKIADK